MDQREAGDAYSVLEHVDVLLFVEAGLFGDDIEEGRHVTVVIPHEKVAQRGHSVVVPDGLAASVIGVGYFLALQLTVERGLRW